jgi:O-antigen ligase
MMAVCLAAMLLSCFCSLVLKKQEMALLLVLFSFAFIFAYNKEMPVYFYVIPTFCGFFSVVDNNTKNKAFGFLLFWFAAYYCLIIFLNPYEKYIWGWFFRNISLIFLFLWAMLIKWDRKGILFITVSYGSYLLIWGFLEKLTLDPTRVGGPTGSATGYAITLCIFWSIWFVDSCKQKKGLLIIIFPTSLVLLAIVFSGSRMGMIGLGIGILFGIYYYAFTSSTASQTSIVGKSVKFMAIIFFTAIVFLIFWNTFMQGSFVAKAMESLFRGRVDVSNMGRIIAWLSAYDAFSNNKIWGEGPETFSDHYLVFIRKIPNLMMSRKSFPHAHNEILQVLSEFGLIGFVHLGAIVSFCIFSIIKYMRKHRDETICYGIFAGFTIFFILILVDGIPSFGPIPWIMGIMASFYFRENSNIGAKIA